MTSPKIAPLLIPAIVSALAVVSLVPLVRRLAARLRAIDHPRADRYHARPVPLLGGIAVVAGIAAGLAVALALGHAPARTAGPIAAGRLLVAAGLGGAGFLALGLADDRRAIPPFRKGLAEGIVLAVALAVWRPAGLLAGPVPLAVAWILGMVAVNAWNYLDHADGVFATAGSIAAAILATAALRISVTPAAAIAAGLCGSLAAYLVWNAPPARIFLGDAGSLPIGFLMVLVSAAIIDRGGLASAPSVLGSHALPIMDAGLVTFVRLHEGRDPFRGGREHTAHRLIARTGARGALAVVALAGSALGAAGLRGWGCPIAAIAWIAAAMVGGAILLARIPPRPEDSSVPPRSTFAGGGGARPV